MHPLYLVDYIENVKAQLRRDLEIINEQLTNLSKTEVAAGRPYVAVDLDWHVVHLTNSAHKLQHDLLQTRHQLEKLTDASKSL